MTEQEIQKHNSVNMNSLSVKEWETFICVLGIHGYDHGLFTMKSDLKYKYALCVYCASGEIVYNGFSNRNRFRNLVRRYQNMLPDIKCMIIAEVISNH